MLHIQISTEVAAHGGGDGMSMSGTWALPHLDARKRDVDLLVRVVIPPKRKERKRRNLFSCAQELGICFTHKSRKLIT
jgi:hypothetical protein